MATIKKPVIITKPPSLTGSIKQTTATKKPLKPDTVVKKTSIAAPKTTSLASKTPAKPIITKMAPIKVSAAPVDKSTASLKASPAKSSVPSKPVPTKTPVKRAVADSTSSDKEPAVKPVQKLSTPSLTKSPKAVTRPVTSTTSGVKVTAVKTKPALTDKLPVKPVAEKLPAKAKLTSTPSTIASIKPVTSALGKRPLTPKTADIKKPAASKPVLAKSVSKTATSVVKPPSIRTPIAAKKVIKKCTEVQICDADSTSSTANDQLDMEFGVEFGTVTPGETAVEFSEIQAYKVAEQMMEALGPAVVTSEAVQQDSLLKDSVVIDLSALEVANQTVPSNEELAETLTEATVLEQTDCEPVQVENDTPKETEASIPDLISFVEEQEVANGEPTADTSEEVAEVIADEGVPDVTSESAQDEDIESLVEYQVDESDEVPSDGAAVSGDENESAEEITSRVQKFEPCTEDEAQEVENCEMVDDCEMSNSQCDVTAENEVEDENVYDNEGCSLEAEVNFETEEQGEVIDPMPSTTDLEDAVCPTEMLAEQPEELSEEVIDPAISIDAQEDHFCTDSDPASTSVNSDDFVVVELGDGNGDEEKLPLTVDDSSATQAEKSADTESVASVDSAASYADVVKQPAVECAGDFEGIGNEAVLVDLENSSDSLAVPTISDAVAVTEAAVDAESAGDIEAGGDDESTEAAEDTATSEATGDVEGNPVETVKVEPLLGPMTDEVQQELDAGMENSHAVDEEGYEKVQKKRNKRNNKRNRKSQKALQKENTDFEPVAEVQESQDDLMVYQKRKNFRRSRNSTKKQYRRFSEPYSNSHCFSTPVWKSYYVEH